MKEILKKMGRIFMVLDQKEERDIRQGVLLVDGSSILHNNFALIIKGVKEKFKNANLSVLTFKDKEGFLKENFPDVEVIIPEDRGIISKYRLAIKLFSLLRRKYSFIILSSLDISLVFVSIFFSRQPVFLHNRWFEWYRVRCRTFLDMILRAKSADNNRRKINCGMQDTIKSIGRSFIILSNLYEEDISTRVLVADDGRGELGYITTAVKKAKADFINPNVSVITFPGREHYFTGIIPSERVFAAKDSENRFSLAMQIYRMRNNGFSRIVLINLDISPILAAFLFINADVLLYNRWHEWWRLSFRTIYGYIKAILGLLRAIVIFVYLLISCGFVLLRTALGLLLSGLAYNHGKTDE
jgi:hypothetical protein